jgi:serine/threonine protein kinase
MNDAEQRTKLLEMIEQQEELGGRFRNPRRIGAVGGGGYFSLLVKAEDQQQRGRPVALKFAHPFEPHEYRRQCFRREPEVLRLFNGQRDIIQLIAGRVEFIHTVAEFPFPFAFYAIELAESDLASLLEGGGLSHRDRLIHLRAMCRAVQRVHANNVAHRDVKPSNFLLMPGGELKLADFGTARVMDGESSGLLSEYQFPPGDLGYAAPEMLALLHDVEPRIAMRGDVFALGASIFEMFAGVPLGVQLFDESFQDSLIHAMGAVKRAERQRIFDEFVARIEDSRPLPSVAAFAPDIPAGIIQAVNDLYRSTAALDYRKRVCDFESIRRKLERCILTLDNEEKIRRWRSRQRQVHSERIAKAERRSSERQTRANDVKAGG